MLIATIMCGEFIDYIADNLALKVLQKLKSSNFHSALWDGTPDVLVSEKETIFVLYLDKVGSDVEVLVKTKFLGLAEVNHATWKELNKVSMKAWSKSVCSTSQMLVFSNSKIHI